MKLFFVKMPGVVEGVHVWATTGSKGSYVITRDEQHPSGGFLVSYRAWNTNEKMFIGEGVLTYDLAVEKCQKHCDENIL